MGDRYPAPDSSCAAEDCVMKIIIVNFSGPSSAIPATLGSVGLYLVIITMVMPKHPPCALRVIGGTATLYDSGDVLNIIILNKKEFATPEIRRSSKRAVTL